MFPKSETTGYYSDMTRTVSKGEPDEKIREMYAAVLGAKRLAIAPHQSRRVWCGRVPISCGLFQRPGYERNTGASSIISGTVSGCRCTNYRHWVQRVPPEAGHVITVEPGLYYPGIGGVRLEDMGEVTKKGFSCFYGVS